MSELEALKRREYETFQQLARAVERMHAMIHGRLHFPGEGRGFPDPLDAAAARDLRAAREEAEAAYAEWHGVHAALEEQGDA